MYEYSVDRERASDGRSFAFTGYHRLWIVCLAAIIGSGAEGSTIGDGAMGSLCCRAA